MAKDRLPRLVQAQTANLHPGKTGSTPVRKTPTGLIHRILGAKPVLISGGFRAMLLLFHHALQGMLVLARKIHHLRYLGLGDFVGEHPALPDSMMMDVEHDLGRGFD